MVSRKKKVASSKKRHLDKVGKQTKWAPFWTVLKIYGKGKKIHPSAHTHIKRNWRTRKLKFKPRKDTKQHLG
ncbi:MAG: ribosomal protein L39E [Patescibacteria group bacterium]|jgi:ribosomal protein L39E